MPLFDKLVLGTFVLGLATAWSVWKVVDSKELRERAAKVVLPTELTEYDDFVFHTLMIPSA